METEKEDLTILCGKDKMEVQHIYEDRKFNDKIYHNSIIKNKFYINNTEVDPLTFWFWPTRR